MAYKFDPKDETTNLSETGFYSDMERKRRAIGDLGMKMIQVMASEGISEEPELTRMAWDVIAYLTSDPISTTSIWRCFDALRSTFLIKTEEVNTGIRRFHIHRLTADGKLFAIHYFKKAPVESEYERFIREHASVHHGYLIKDTKKILEEKGIYDSVTTGRTENRIVISEKHACIPDIVGVYDDIQDCYEVECGTHNQKEFNYKCSKLAHVTSNILFVAQNRQVLKKTIVKQVEHWIDMIGREKLKELGIWVYLTTLKDLQNNKWTYIYDMTADKPICCFGKKKGGES